jgi:hypothetical protein
LSARAIETLWKTERRPLRDWLEFNHGRDALVHDDDDALATACARLLQDDALADATASAAHQKARSLYSLADLPTRIARELRAGLADHATVKHHSAKESGSRFGRQYGRPVHFPIAPGPKRESR